MQKSPYKFLDSYSREDRDFFFGRDREIEELYSRVFESRILVVYGISGTGKSSLINCGLANKFNDSDWLPINIRRGININQSLLDGLERVALTESLSENKTDDLIKIIQSVYFDHFKPIYLIFDQFEELFIFGNNKEKEDLIGSIKEVIESDLQCRFIFSIREEYLAGLTEFEKVIPSFLANRIRIDKMTRQNAIQVIEGPCHLSRIDVESGFSGMLLEKLNPDNPDVELAYLQVYLDKVFRMAPHNGDDVKRFTIDLLSRAGDVKDLLGSFLEEQISQLDDPDAGLVILKSFVSVKGTKHQINEDQAMEYSRTLGTKIDSKKVKDLIQKFIRLRILRDKDENGRYELRHDSLASKIYEKITLVEKELLEIRQFLENAYNNFEKRHLYLTAEDLKYIAPYEDRLYLNERISKFISQSKWVAQRAKRRRQYVLISTAAVIITVLALFSAWAIRERGNAIDQKKIADDQKNTALKAKETADLSNREAQISRQEAVASRNLAIEQKNIADDQRKRAEQNAIEAAKQRTIALEQTDSANRASIRADNNARIAEKERIETLRLRMLSVGKAAAIKSLQLKGQKDLQTLLAYQAYIFNSNNGGYYNDADIFQGLYNVAKQYGGTGYKEFRGHNGEIKSIAFIPGGKEFFTSGFDGKLLKWILDDKEPNPRVIYSGSEIIEVLAVNPDKTWLACGGRNSVIRMIPVNEGNSLQYELTGHKTQINSLAFSGDRKFLYSASLDGKVLKWDLVSKSYVEVAPDKILITSVDISSDGNYLAGVSNDGKTLVWNPEKAEDYFRIEEPGKFAKRLKFNPESNLLAIGYSDGFVELWDIIKRLKVSEVNAHSAQINAIRFNNLLSQMATASDDGTLKIWDVRDLTTPPMNFDDNEGFVMSVEFSPDGQFIVSGTYEGVNNLVARATNADLLAKEMGGTISRYLTQSEWSTYIGKDIRFENPGLK